MTDRPHFIPLMGHSMKLIQPFVLALLIASLVMALASTTLADEESSGNRQKTELGIRQQLVQRKMVELELKFTVVAEKIREKDPKRADLLIETYQKSREQSLTTRMERVSELLNEGKYVQAQENLDEVTEILESLIRLLTDEKNRELSPKDEMDMLEKFKQQVTQQLQQQRKQTREAEKAANRKESLEQVEAQIRELNRLIDQQKKLMQENIGDKNTGLRQLDELADKQFELRKATERLKDAVGGVKKKSAEQGMPSEGTPGGSESEQGEKNPGDSGNKPPKGSDAKGDSKGDAKQGKPGEPNESGEDVAEAKAGDAKGSESKPSDGKGSESKPSDGKEGTGQQSSSPSGGKPDSSGSATPPAPPQPGQQSLQKASDSQQAAEEKLGSGKPEEAKAMQAEAVEQLSKALSELEKEKRRIESLPPEVLEQLAREQRRSRNKSLDLIRKMKESPTGKQPDGQPESQAGQQPGQQQMQEASDAQGQAGKSLEDGDSDSANQQQQQAEKKMEEALEEIEDRLSQLREETNEEKLARLEGRFREMLDRQKIATIMTTEIDDKRLSLGRMGRRDQLLILRLATEELDIRELGQQAYDLLLEDGTSQVFPEVVQDVRTDLATVAEMLQQSRTDRYTQLVQKEVETAIADLIDALEEVKKKNEGGGGGGGGGGGKQPLLRKSAELKILRMRQQRLNRRTRRLEIMRDDPKMIEAINKEVGVAAEIQKKILEMAENLMQEQQ